MAGSGSIAKTWVIITCPDMTEICREHCYEKKIETTYGSNKVQTKPMSRT